MTTIVIAAILCAICTLYLIIPIAAKNRYSAHGLMVALPLLSLSLYLLLGSPGLPSAAALFEKDELRIQARSIVKGELKMMEALSKDPENVDLMLALGSIRIAGDRSEDAIGILKHAHDLDPDNEDVKLQLGAAYFVSGLYEMEDNRRAQALEDFRAALKIAPANAPYKKDLKNIIETLK